MLLLRWTESSLFINIFLLHLLIKIHKESVTRLPKYNTLETTSRKKTTFLLDFVQITSRPVRRQLSVINCQNGQLSVRTTVRSDNCQIGQLADRTTVSGDNCQWGQLSVA